MTYLKRQMNWLGFEGRRIKVKVTARSYEWVIAAGGSTDNVARASKYQLAIKWTTRCVALPSLMAAPWVGQNSGPVFRRLWTKLHRIKFACARMSVVCNAVFRLTISCCFPEIYAIESRNRLNFDVLGRHKISGWGGATQIADRIL